ncbi:MAG TPA: hypothetical protein VGD56_06225 [Gemmatirosa sp.]
MTDLALRPRSASEIIDLAVRLVRRHFVGFFAIAFVGMLPGFVASALLVAIGVAPNGLASAERVFSFVIATLTVAVLTIYADDALRTDAPEVGPAFARAASRIGVVLGVSLLSFLATMVGVILFIVPGVYIGLRLATAVPAAAVESDGVGDVLRRTWARGDGHVLHTLKVMLVFLLIVFVFIVIASVVGGVTGLVAGFAGGLAGVGVATVLITLATLVVSAALYPVFTTAVLLLTYDLRVRREGYDVESMAAALGAAG